MHFQTTAIHGALIIEAESRSDERGWFARVACVEEFRARGIDPAMAQTNIAHTRYAGTVRGLHYQLPPAAESKLVYCIAGAIYDVAVDVRSDSPTFGEWVGTQLDADRATAVYVPSGCAHGYQALTDDTRVLYQVGAPYTPNLERGIHHADPALAITWPLQPRYVSDKDRNLPALAAAHDLPFEGTD